MHRDASYSSFTVLVRYWLILYVLAYCYNIYLFTPYCYNIFLFLPTTSTKRKQSKSINGINEIDEMFDCWGCFLCWVGGLWAGGSCCATTLHSGMIFIPSLRCCCLWLFLPRRRQAAQLTFFLYWFSNTWMKERDCLSLLRKKRHNQSLRLLIHSWINGGGNKPFNNLSFHSTKSKENKFLFHCFHYIHSLLNGMEGIKKIL